MITAADYRYDACISYSHRDRAWVDSYLLPPLETAGLRVAIDYRDFAIGEMAADNMERMVETSRHVVVVMSPNWVQSEWSRYEYLFAGDPVGRNRTIIPVLIAPTELPRRYSLRTYADLTDPVAFEREMARVIDALRPFGTDGSQASAAAPAPVPTPVTPPIPATLNWQAETADLLVRSGRAHASSRRALCIEIGVDADSLAFLDASPRDFAVQLVNHLDATGNTEGLLALCTVLKTVLRGVFAERLQSVTEGMRRSRSG